MEPRQEITRGRYSNSWNHHINKPGVLGANATTTDLDHFLTAIGHPLRRHILLTIYENPNIAYSQIQARVNISSGKLNFHLQKLEGFLTHKDGQYNLSDEGLKLLRTLGVLEQRLTGKDKVHGDVPGFLFGRRLLAFFIDVTLVVAILFIAADISSISIEPAWWLGFFPVPQFITRIVETFIVYPDLNVVLIRAYIFAVIWMYFTVFEGYRGQTLGKMVLGIRIVDISGARMSPHEAAIRALTKVLILPIDVLVGLVKTRKVGFLRFFGHYTRTWVIKT